MKHNFRVSANRAARDTRAKIVLKYNHNVVTMIGDAAGSDEELASSIFWTVFHEDLKISRSFGSASATVLVA